MKQPYLNSATQKSVKNELFSRENQSLMKKTKSRKMDGIESPIIPILEKKFAKEIDLDNEDIDITYSY